VNVDLRGLAGTSKAKLSEAALILLFTNNSAVIQESYDNSRRSIRISEQYALSNGFTQIKTQGAGIFKREVIVADTWFNEPDVYRHFIWNVYNVRDLGERDAIIATNMHEINAFKDGWYISGMDTCEQRAQGFILTKMNKDTLMDIWNNRVGIELGQNQLFKSYSDEDLFKYARDNDMLILSPADVDRKYGFDDSYFSGEDWTVIVLWDYYGYKMTIMSENKGKEIIKVNW